MNNNYGFRMTDNYRVYLKLLEKNRENESSDDSEFDSDYDGRLDDEFNRMIKESKMKKLVKEENLTFIANEPRSLSPTEYPETPKESVDPLQLHRVKLESESFIVNSPNFTPSLNSTMCSSLEEAGNKQSASFFAAQNESVREESTQQKNFFNTPQSGSESVVDIQQDDGPFQRVFDYKDRSPNQRQVDTQQVVHGTNLAIKQEPSSFVALEQSVREDVVEQHFLNSTQDEEQSNASSVAHNQSGTGFEEEMRQDSPIQVSNQSDRAEVNRKENNVVHNPNISDGQEEVENLSNWSNWTINSGYESSWADCDSIITVHNPSTNDDQEIDKENSLNVGDEETEKQVKTSNATMSNGNEDSWTDYDSFADEEVFK